MSNLDGGRFNVMSRELRYSRKPGPSFRKSKEDLALFEHLPDNNDLDSCLEPVALGGDQLLEGSINKDVSDSATDKNDDEWLVPAPEVSLSPQSHASNLIINRNLSAIKTSRSATLEPTRVSTPQPNPSPTLYKGLQESKTSPSRIPRFNASNSNITVRKSSPGPSSIPRASSSPRTSTPSSIPRASSSPRISTSGIRPPSPKSKWTSSSKTTPAQTPKSTLIASQTPKSKSTLASKGSTLKFTRASTTSPSTSTGKRLSSNYGSTRSSPASSSVTSLPTQPGSARSVKSVASPSVTVTVKAAKPSFTYDYLSETPANLRTDPFSKRAGSASHVRSLSRSYDGPGYSGSNSGSLSNFQDYVSKSQDRGPTDLSRSQDQGVFQYSSSKVLTGDGRAFNSDEDFPTKIPAYGGVGPRTLKKDDDLLKSSQQILGRATPLYQHDKSAVENYSFMGRSSIPDPSCSTVYTAQVQSSLNISGGFKPFMTNSSISSFSQHRKLHDPEFEASQPVSIAGSQDLCEDITPVVTKSSWDSPKNRFGYGNEESSSYADQTSTVKRSQMGFALKKDDVGMHTELPTSSLIDMKANNMDVGIPHLSTTVMISHVEDKGPVKIYQGLGDMEDMGGNWCCGMANQYRGLCKQHECVIFKNFHYALVNNSSTEFSQPCSSTSSQDSLNDKSPASDQLGKPPDFFDVTKRCEDGGIVAAISSVKSLSASECGDDDQRVNGKFTTRSSSEPFNRSSSMNGSHVSHSDSEDKEEVDQTRATRAFSPESDATLARSDSDGEMVKSKTSNYLEESDYHGTASAQSDHSPSDTPDDSPRELMSEFSRASSTKSNIRRFFSTSATSIDLTRSIDTTCSTQSPYEYNIWEEPSDSGRFEGSMSTGLRISTQQKGSMHMDIREPVKVEGACSDIKTQASIYDNGLEKLAGYIRSASVNARKRRASVASSETDSKISLSRESSFDYFMDLFEAQTKLDPEARAVTDLLVSAHIEAKRVEFSPRCSNLKRMNSLLSSSSLRRENFVEVAKEVSWESNKSIQTLENSREGTEQIVERATLSLDKHFSSFKFGQKKYPAGEFENITTLEVVPVSPTLDSRLSPSRRRFAKLFSGVAISEPSPICQKFLKEIEEQHNLCEGHALSALKSAPLEPAIVKYMEVVSPPKEEEGLQAPPASPLDPKCESPRSSSGNDIADSCNEIKSVAAVQTLELDVDVEIEKEKEKENAKANPDEEPDSHPVEIEKAMVEQVLLPPVPNQMSKEAPRDAPVMSPVRMTSTSPTKLRANGHEVGDNNEKTCGCTIL